MSPPVSELSSPMMAFCTVFDSESSTTRSNGLSCANSRLPNTRKATTIKTYTRIGRSIFSTTGAPRANMSLHILPFPSQSAIHIPPPEDYASGSGGFMRLLRFRAGNLLKHGEGRLFRGTGGKLVQICECGCPTGMLQGSCGVNRHSRPALLYALSLLRTDVSLGH